MKHFYFQLLRIHFLAQIITDRPSPGSTTMDDVLNSLLGLQQQGATSYNARFHHHSSGGVSSSSRGDLKRRPNAASGMANV